MGWVVNGTPELDAQSQYREVTAICIVFGVIMVGVVGARVYERPKESTTWMVAVAAVCNGPFPVLTDD